MLKRDRYSTRSYRAVKGMLGKAHALSVPAKKVRRGLIRRRIFFRKYLGAHAVGVGMEIRQASVSWSVGPASLRAVVVPERPQFHRQIFQISLLALFSRPAGGGPFL